MRSLRSLRRPSPTRSRAGIIATALATLAAGMFVATSTQHFASAIVTTGPRPVLIPIEPCRLADTRPGDNQVGPRGAALGVGDTLTIDAQEPGVPCDGDIPADALTLSLNVTALNASEPSFLTIWAGGQRPLASSLNPAPGQPPVPNAVVVDLSVDQTFDVYNEAGAVDIVVDVNGYYADHNHDDRYMTDAEVASEIDSRVGVAIDAAVIKQIQLPLAGASYSINTFYSPNNSRGGGRFPDNVNNDAISFNFVLPIDYTENSTFYFDMLWMIEEASCSFGVQRASSTIARPGAVSRGGDIDDTSFQEPSGGSKVVNSLRIPWVPTGDGARAGDAVHVSFYRTADTCTADVIFQGLTVSYT